MLGSLSAGVPESKIARAVTDFARQAYPRYLFNHCVRTFWFADRLAASGLKFDREIVYIAAMLHDLGALETYDQGARFEVDGAQAARDFLERHVYPAEKIEVVWDAIALHTDLEGIAQYKEPEVRLVNLGTGADAVGRRIAGLEPRFVRELIEEFPRLDFPNEFRQALIENVRRRPSRAGGTFLAPVRQMDELFTNNPLDAM